MSNEKDIQELKYDVSNKEWHNIGDTNEPAFTNSWQNFNTTLYHGAGFRKLANGNVQLRGMISTGTLATAAFTLPAGYRPTKTIPLDVVSNSVMGKVDIDSAGQVVPQSPSSNTWVSLEGKIFNAG